jgi:hypothetical protein
MSSGAQIENWIANKPPRTVAYRVGSPGNPFSGLDEWITETGLLRDADPPGPDLRPQPGRPGLDGPGGPDHLWDRSGAVGPPARVAVGPRRPGSAAWVSMVTAAMPVTTLPSWRAGEARRSARPERRRPRPGWPGRRLPWHRCRRRCRCARRKRGRRRTRNSARPRSKWCA